MGWGRPRPEPESSPPAEMKRVKLAEVWSDDEGFMAIGTKNGGYMFYVDVDSIVRGNSTLAEAPFMQTRINLAVLSITKAIREGK